MMHCTSFFMQRVSTPVFDLCFRKKAVGGKLPDPKLSSTPNKLVISTEVSYSGDPRTLRPFHNNSLSQQFPRYLTNEWRCVAPQNSILVCICINTTLSSINDPPTRIFESGQLNRRIIIMRWFSTTNFTTTTFPHNIYNTTLITTETGT